MSAKIPELVAAIRGFEPIDGNWLPLDRLIGELFEVGGGSDGIDAMLSVLERNPTEDGGGVLWSIVHGLESLPGYEPALVESIRRIPSELSVAMIGRLLNAGVATVGGVSLAMLIREAAERRDAALEVRRAAQKILNRASR